MSSIKPQLNLIINKKMQPQLKPKEQQLLLQTDSKNNQNYQSNSSSQNNKYLYNNVDKAQFNNSQAIIDKVNNINKIQTDKVNSPINQFNLQLVNQHLISHFQNSEDRKSFLNNYQQYREKIEQALMRSAENIKKFNRSKSESKSTEDMPSNPLQKIRFNRFSQYNENKKVCHESLQSKINQESNKDTVYTFDNQNTRYSMDKQEQNSSPKIEKQKEQSQSIQENEVNETGKSQYHELYEQYKILEQQYIRKQQEVTGMSQQIKKIKKENMNLRKENMNLLQQKNEIEQILKDILLKKERNKFRKVNNNSMIEESQKSSLHRYTKSLEKNKQLSSLESDSDPKPQSIFELSTSNNNQTKDQSQMQDSWMSASFLTHGKSQEEEGTGQVNKNIMMLDLKQLSNKNSEKKQKLKIHSNNIRYLEQQLSQEESKKKKKVNSNKENSQQFNRF